MPSYNAIHIDDSRWEQHNAWLNVADPEIRIHYIECKPASGSIKGTILLIHGFPQTSYQFRHVITPLADAGYHVIVPDYRGAGESSHPKEGYTKMVMAADLHELVTKHIGVKGKIHVVGHDIGGIIAHAFIAQFPESVASVIWGECPLPGTSVYEKHKHTDFLYHFTFQNVPDLPEALVTGRERIYLKHFYDRLIQNPSAIGVRDLEHYTIMYSQPGALRCAFDVYRAFETDAEDNRQWLKKNGKSKIPALALSGERSFIAKDAEGMVKEMYEDVTSATVEGTGHWLAEENPTDFVKKVLSHVGKHEGGTPK